MQESISGAMERFMMEEMMQDVSHPLIPSRLVGRKVFDWYISSGLARNCYFVAKKFSETGGCSSLYHDTPALQSQGQDTPLPSVLTGVVTEKIGISFLKQGYPGLVLLSGENKLGLMQKFNPYATRIHHCLGDDSLDSISTPDVIAAEFDDKGNPIISFFGEITASKVDEYLKDRIPKKIPQMRYLGRNFPSFFRSGNCIIYLMTPNDESYRDPVIITPNASIRFDSLPFSRRGLYIFMRYFLEEYRPNEDLPPLAQVSDIWVAEDSINRILQSTS